MIIFSWLWLNTRMKERWQKSCLCLCLATTQSIVHYVNMSGVLWHSVWEYHQFKIWNSKTTFCFTNSFYSWHVQETGCGIGAILWLLFVSNYIVIKKQWHTIFPISKKSIFLYTVFPLEKFSIVHFISLIVVFFTRKMWL